jgi:hypothetical protein
VYQQWIARNQYVRSWNGDSQCQLPELEKKIVQRVSITIAQYGEAGKGRSAVAVERGRNAPDASTAPTQFGLL